VTIATVILAAGGSSRMGSPKQLLPYQGRPLVAHAMEAALRAGLGPVFVVVGANEEQVRGVLRESGAKFVSNAGWEAGIGSSIKAGIAAAAADRDVEAAIVMLADQPMIDASVLAGLARLRRERASEAAACSYGGLTGVPALFTRSAFSRLSEIPDRKGAKEVLQVLGDGVALLDCPQAAMDIDTPDDYRRLSESAVSPAVPIESWYGAQRERRTDPVAAEEPLEIRIRNRPISVTMRTPGNDEELAAGFLVSEGLIRSREEVLAIEPCEDRELGNVINVKAAPLVQIDFKSLTRHVFMSSSCGVCGKASIEAVRAKVPPVATSVRVSAGLLREMPREMRARQTTFSETGGLHAAAIFEASGKLLVLREDVGRHNAVDKAIGRLFLDGLAPLSKHILLVSGRASFEIVQKAAAAGIGIVAAVSAPSSLAASFAQEMNQTLIGFLRPPRFNVYAHSERIEQ
jgi:FdhD protein